MITVSGHPVYGTNHACLGQIVSFQSSGVLFRSYHRYDGRQTSMICSRSLSGTRVLPTFIYNLRTNATSDRDPLGLGLASKASNTHGTDLTNSPELEDEQEVRKRYGTPIRHLGIMNSCGPTLSLVDIEAKT